MPENKPDRRIQRTQSLLREALVALILEKGYTQITVQDILDRANLGRSTFYAHYRDKDDLLLSGFGDMMADFERKYSQISSHAVLTQSAAEDFSLFMFRHVDENKHIFKAMIGEKGGEIIENYARKALTQIVRAHIVANVGNRQLSIPMDLLVHYVVSNYLAFLTWWLDHDTPYSPEQLDAMFRQLVTPGIIAVLG